MNVRSSQEYFTVMVDLACASKLVLQSKCSEALAEVYSCGHALLNIVAQWLYTRTNR